MSVHRKSGLTEVMSQICDRVFGLTPVINNESVNKNEITSIAANSRNKIISALLRNELEPNLGLSGTGQEVSIMRSTLLRTGIWSEEGGISQLNLHPTDAAMRNMLETIENFVLEARQNGRISFSELSRWREIIGTPLMKMTDCCLQNPIHHFTPIVTFISDLQLRSSCCHILTHRSTSPASCWENNPHSAGTPWRSAMRSGNRFFPQCPQSAPR